MTTCSCITVHTKNTNTLSQKNQKPDFDFCSYFHHRSDSQRGFWGKVVLPGPGTCVLAAPWHPMELGAAEFSWVGQGRAGHGQPEPVPLLQSDSRTGWLGHQPTDEDKDWAWGRQPESETGSGCWWGQDEARSGNQSMGHSLDEWASWTATHVALDEEERQNPIFWDQQLSSSGKWKYISLPRDCF